MPDGDSGEVVQLHQRAGYRPDLAALAREELRQARHLRDLDESEFADLLTPLLGWTVTADVVTSWETTAVPPGDVLVAAGLIGHAAAQPNQDHPDTDIVGRILAERMADLTAVYATRAEFAAGLPIRDLFNGAITIRAAGLSLNLICQQFGDKAIRSLVEGGTRLQCLFLEPGGSSIRAREAEEGFQASYLSALTELNIQGLIRGVRDRLDDDSRDLLEIATYNEPIRFNITIVNSEDCVVQPYLPETRGVDSPTFVIRRRPGRTGLYATFDHILNSLWEKRRPL